MAWLDTLSGPGECIVHIVYCFKIVNKSKGDSREIVQSEYTACGQVFFFFFTLHGHALSG